MTSPSKPRPSRILIVDDHPLVRRGLAQIIDDQDDLKVCGEAEDVPTAIKQFEAMRPDLVIIDVSLRNGSGVDLVKALKQRDKNARLLVFSMHDDALFAERVVSAGALGYVNKQVDHTTLLNAIRHVLTGKVYLNSALAEQLMQRLRDTGKPSPTHGFESLSDRELEVLEMIGRGFSLQQIAEKLHLSRKTVESYRENTKRKLNVASAPELVRLAVLWVVENRGV